MDVVKVGSCTWLRLFESPARVEGGKMVEAPAACEVCLALAGSRSPWSRIKYCNCKKDATCFANLNKHGVKFRALWFSQLLLRISHPDVCSRVSSRFGLITRSLRWKCACQRLSVHYTPQQPRLPERDNEY